jgi:hypothetical protein
MKVPCCHHHRVLAFWTFFLVVIPCLGGKIGEIRRLSEDGVHWEPMFDIPRNDSPGSTNEPVGHSDEVPIFVGIASFRDGKQFGQKLQTVCS